MPWYIAVGIGGVLGGSINRVERVSVQMYTVSVLYSTVQYLIGNNEVIQEWG